MMKGIDISAWQSGIDWQAMKDAGIEFVIIKIGQGGRLDEMFQDHMQNAAAFGMKIGVYVYSVARSLEEAIAEADWTATQIQTGLPEMGVWYDVEDEAIAQSGVDITALCAAFVMRLCTYGFNLVGVYSSYNWLTNGNIQPERLGDTPYWCAQYNHECNFENPNLLLWQYTDSLNIAGTNFDGNMTVG